MGTNGSCGELVQKFNGKPEMDTPTGKFREDITFGLN
jgi:hypothetical protein